MRVSDFEMFARAIGPLEAQEVLLSIQCSSYPHMEAQKGKKLFADLKRVAFPFEMTRGDYVTTEDLANMLGKGEQ